MSWTLEAKSQVKMKGSSNVTEESNSSPSLVQVKEMPFPDDNETNSQGRGRFSHSSKSKPRFIRRRTEIIAVAVLAVVLAIAIFCAATFATHANNTSFSGPLVDLSYGRYQGVSLSNGVTQFLGVRYASPPDRFSAPEPVEPFQGVHIADTTAPGCRGAGTFGLDKEDCLFADVYSPTGANSSSKLPVYVFIQGGGLTNANIHANGTNLVVASNKSIVMVSFSYRAGVFGFLASPEVQKDGSLNIGYLDQRQLLKWVQKEIPQFGGDPGHVVIGGQSAGAGSVVHQLTAYGGVDAGLFHGAIMESSSMPAIRNVTEQQFQYDHIVQRAGCHGQANTLACLRGKSGQEILDAAKSIPYPGAVGSPVFQWAPVVDGDFVRDLSTSAIQQGNFIKVPIVFGDDTDEGTVFTPRSIKDEIGAKTFIKNNWPTITSSQLDRYTSMYGFGQETPAGTYWKRAAAAYGETRYTCPGIHMSNLVVKQPGMSNKVWNWRYNVATQSQINSGNGVGHGSEIMAIFGPSANGAGEQYELLTSNSAKNNIVNHVQSYWISFIRTLNPNQQKAATAPDWTVWTGTNRVLFNINGTTMETIEQEQLDRCGYLAQITLELKQ